MDSGDARRKMRRVLNTLVHGDGPKPSDLRDYESARRILLNDLARGVSATLLRDCPTLAMAAEYVRRNRLDVGEIQRGFDSLPGDVSQSRTAPSGPLATDSTTADSLQNEVGARFARSVRPQGAGAAVPRLAAVQDRREYDVVYLTALDEEGDALRQRFTEDGGPGWTEVPGSLAPTTLWQTERLASNGDQLRILCCSVSRMGSVPASALTASLILRFNPLLLVMTGIAAGLDKEEYAFGDILVPEVVLDPTGGKISEDNGEVRFSVEPKWENVDQLLLRHLRPAKTKRLFLDEIREASPCTKPTSKLDVHLTIHASTPFVVDASVVASALKNFQRKLTSLDMEVYGFYLAARRTLSAAPYFLAIKGLQDFAANKRDTESVYRAHAMYTATSYAKRVVLEHLWERLKKEP